MTASITLLCQCAYNVILRSLSLSGFRNLANQNIEFHEKCNVFYGENASGKTSLLEAIYYLSHLRSFRQREFSKIIQEESEFFRLICKCLSPESDHLIGIEVNKDEHTVRVDANPLKQRSTLAKMLPCLYLDPETGKLLTESPKLRRQFMDWGLFHTEANYHHLWQYYDRVLKQRNILLRSRSQLKMLDSYDELLIQYGDQITEKRHAFIAELFEKAGPLLSRLIKQPFDWSIDYRKGYTGESFAEELKSQREKDIAMGYTRTGPHRGDFMLKANHKNVSEYLSRGQIKLASIALTLAQVQLFQSYNISHNVILLMDDMSAELDKQHREILLEEFFKLNIQLFITCLEENEFPELKNNELAGEFYQYKITTGLLQKML